MTQLLMIRHGPTDWNEQGRIQGRADPSLSPAGRRLVQSYRVPAQCQGWAWVSSPLARARETATIMAGHAPAIEPCLIEMDWGSWEGETLAALRARLGAEMETREALGLDFRPPSGESPRDVQERLRPWLLRLADAGRPTIAVTHKGVVRALYAQARDWPMIGKAPDSLQWDHAHLFSIAATGRAMLERVNIRLIP
ncbi:MAG: histidine phosphatase family protein [Alphaproteobacteria bacterium]